MRASRGTTILVAVAVVVPTWAAWSGVASGANGGGTQANAPQVNPAYLVSGVATRFPTNKQNEPTIARNPGTGAFLAGSNDEQVQPACGPGGVRGATALGSDCSFYDGVGTSAVYTSPDGKAWQNRGMLPGFSDPEADSHLTGPAPTRALVSDGDPVLVYGPRRVAGGFDPDHWTAYYASLAAYRSDSSPGNQVPELLTVSRSHDDGATWSAPVVAADGHGTLFNDKESLWADRTPGSPYFGRLYMSWTQFRGAGAEPINVVYSADGGTTWSLPNQLSSAYNNGSQGGRQGSVVRTGPDGTVYVVWEDSVQGQSVQVMATSRDGGVTFSKSSVIGPVSDLADPIYGSNFRTSSFPTVAVSQSSPTSYRLHVAWTNKVTATTAELVVATAAVTNGGVGAWARTTVAGANNGLYEFYPALDVAPNGRVDLGWQAQTTKRSYYGTGAASVAAYYSSSTDGASWAAPVQVSAATDPAASAQNNLARQFWGDYNTMASTDAGAWFIYTDARSGAGCAAVDAYQHALDDGTTAVKPAPGNDCSPGFGDTDIYVSAVVPGSTKPPRR